MARPKERTRPIPIPEPTRKIRTIGATLPPIVPFDSAVDESLLLYGCGCSPEGDTGSDDDRFILDEAGFALYECGSEAIVGTKKMGLVEKGRETCLFLLSRACSIL